MQMINYRRATGITVMFLLAMELYKPVLAAYVESVGLNAFQLGLFFSVFSLVVVILGSLMGKLTDTLGRDSVVRLGVLAILIGLILYMLDTRWQILLIARALDAVAWSAVMVAGMSKMEDSLSDKERGRLSGLNLSLQGAAVLLAPIIGGVLADRFSIKFPFITSFVMMTILLAYLLFQKGEKKREVKGLNPFKELKKFFSDRRLRGMAFLGMVMHAAAPLIVVFIPLMILDKFGLSYSYVGLAIFAFYFTHMFQYFIGSIVDRIGRARSVLIGTFFYGVIAVLLPLMKDYASLIILMAVWGTFGAVWNTAAWSFMSDIGERGKKEGHVVGSYFSFAKIGAFVSFVLGGLIVQLYGTEALMYALGYLVIITTVLVSRMVLYEGIEI